MSDYLPDGCTDEQCSSNPMDKEEPVEEESLPVDQNTVLTRESIIALVNNLGSGASEGYALACSDIAVIVERNLIRFLDQPRGGIRKLHCTGCGKLIATIGLTVRPFDGWCATCSGWSSTSSSPRLNPATEYDANAYKRAMAELVKENGELHRRIKTLKRNIS